VGLGKQFQENERGLAEFLAIAMMLTALFDWIGVLYPEEFKRAGAAAVQKRDANTGQQT
jgi:hypothetical protein